MIDRRLIIGGVSAAVVVSLGATVGAGLWLNGIRDSGGTGTASMAHSGAVSAESLAALSDIAAPSRATPLPGSTDFTGGSYRVAGSCDTLRAAYHAKGAPIPTGATVSDAADGVLLVTTKVATSAIVPTDSGDACAYLITSDPTVEITGKEPIPAAAGFVTVGCISTFKEAWQGFEAVGLTIGGTPTTIAIWTGADLQKKAPPASAYHVMIAPGVPTDVATRIADVEESEFVASGQAVDYPATLSSDVDGRITAKLGGAAKGETIRLTCTAPFGSVFYSLG